MLLRILANRYSGRVSDNKEQVTVPTDALSAVLGVDPQGREAVYTVREERVSDSQPTPSLVERIKALVSWVQGTRIMRGMSRYGNARGGLLAGGIAYSALFSITAALTVAWTIFMATLGNNPAMRESVIGAINTALPGILDDGSNGGLIDPDALILTGGLSIASIIAGGVLLWTAISIMTGLSRSIRAMFGINQVVENGVVNILRSFGGFVVLAAGIVVSGVFAAGAGAAGTWLFGKLGIESSISQFFIKLAVWAVAICLDGLIIAFLVRVMAGMRVPRADLLRGAVLGGLIMTVIKIAGTSVVSSVSSNPLLAPFAALATLLLWLNLTARIMLMVSAYMANPPRVYTPEDARELRGHTTPNFVTLTVPESLEWPHDPITGALLPEPKLPLQEEIEELPEWGGLQGNWARKRAEKLEDKARKASEDARAARERYRDGQRQVQAQQANREKKH